MHRVQDEQVFFRTYALPLILFILLSLLGLVIESAFAWDHPKAAWWQQAPEMLVYPLQTLVCAAYLWHTRRQVQWDWSWSASLIGAIAGLIGIGFWLCPYLLSWVDATEGFKPARIFGEGSTLYYLQYSLRFARAVIIVPMVEEFFWRGYLMRLCVNSEEPQKVPFGTHSWRAFVVTLIGFMLIHQSQDYAGALIFGTLAYLVTVQTKRLSAVVTMHAVANLVMGICAIAYALHGLW